MKKIKKIAHLPQVINTRIVKVSSRGYVAELLEYGVHTEADSLEELDYMVNDLIYAYFDVPKAFWGRVRYERKELTPDPAIPSNRKLSYEQFFSSQLIPQFV